MYIIPYIRHPWMKVIIHKTLTCKTNSIEPNQVFNALLK